MNVNDKPLAVGPYKSYRYLGPSGWIMIGAMDSADALNEAKRSTHNPIDHTKLQEWDGKQYVAAEHYSDTVFREATNRAQWGFSS